MAGTTPTTIDTTEEETNKKKNIAKKSKGFKEQYDKTIGAIDDKIAYAQAIFQFVNKVTEATSHGEVYVPTDEEMHKFGDKGPDKLLREYENIMTFVAEQEEYAEKWLQKRLDDLTELEKNSPFGKALEIAQKAQQEYLIEFVKTKAEEKIKAML